MDNVRKVRGEIEAEIEYDVSLDYVKSVSSGIDNFYGVIRQSYLHIRRKNNS